jgi:hypothetical protein
MVFNPIAITLGECSGVIRDTLNAAGIPTISCDLKPSETPGPHMQCSWYEALPTRSWQLAISHYECTALAVSGNAHYAKGKPRWPDRLQAIREAEGLWRLMKRHSVRAAFENPRGVLGTMSDMGRATMTVQPYEYGDDASKRTDWWLHRLPPWKLHAELRVSGRMVEWPVGSGKMVERWANQTDSGQNRLAPSDGRAAERAKTYQGWADAIARDWAPLLHVVGEMADGV